MTFAGQPPRAKIIKYEETTRIFERIHLDYTGPVNGKSFLIVTDSFSKWPEVAVISKTDAETTVEKVREWVASFGLPDTMYRDNSRQFTPEAFVNFCKNNRIRCKTSPPYHPASNGAAENAVKTFTCCLLKALSNKKNIGTSL